MLLYTHTHPQAHMYNGIVSAYVYLSYEVCPCLVLVTQLIEFFYYISDYDVCVIHTDYRGDLNKVNFYCISTLKV